MDRSNNVEVLEALRALNVFLNHSAQLENERFHGKTGGLWDRLLTRTEAFGAVFEQVVPAM